MIFALALWAGTAWSLLVSPFCAAIVAAGCGLVGLALWAAAGRRSLLATCLFLVLIGLGRGAVAEQHRQIRLSHAREGPFRGWLHAETNSEWRNERAHFEASVMGGDLRFAVSARQGPVAGEEWLVDGDVRLFPPAQWPGDMDVQSVESRHGVFAELRVETVLARRQAPNWLDHIARWRRILSLPLQRTRGGAVAASIVTGDRSALTPDDDAAFRRGGIVHILSVSGLHLSAAALVFFVVLRLLLGLFLPWWAFSPRRVAAIGCLFPMAFYCLFTGAELPAVRSALMTALVMLAVVFGARVSGRVALAAALIVCTLAWPLSVGEPTFLFSFGSVFVLVTWISRWSPPKRWWSPVVTLIIASAWATLFSWPLSAYFFHRLAFGGLWNNLWAVPFTSVLMIPVGLLWLALAALVFPRTCSSKYWRRVETRCYGPGAFHRAKSRGHFARSKRGWRGCFSRCSQPACVGGWQRSRSPRPCSCRSPSLGCVATLRPN